MAYALMPKTARKGVGVLLLLMFAPCLLALVLRGATELFERFPVLWGLLAIIVLYRIGKWLFGRY